MRRVVRRLVAVIAAACGALWVFAAVWNWSHGLGRWESHALNAMSGAYAVFIGVRLWHGPRARV